MDKDNIIINNLGMTPKNNEIQENKTVEISASEEKTTPNTIMILKKHYKDCEHTVSNKSTIPEEIVNFTKEEVKQKYSNWELEEFSKEQIILTKTLESFCGEHYLLSEEEGNISIYVVDEEGNRNLKEKTEISVEYLPETDRISLRNGLMIYGTENLNKILEDFES